MKPSFVRETITALSLCVAITLTGGCLDEQHPGQYYTYEGSNFNEQKLKEKRIC